MTTKFGWHVHLHDLTQMSQNQGGASDVITPKSGEKLGRMVTCLDGILSIKSYDPFITWSYKIT